MTGLLRGPAMPIDPSLEDGVFEPEATAAMGEAFEAACKELQDGGEPEVRKLIAKTNYRSGTQAVTRTI